MTEFLPDRKELQSAARILSGSLPLTPHYRWPLLDELAGSTIRVKHDNHLPGGTSQVRAALLHCHAVAREKPFLRQIVCAGGGNRDLAMAFAAQQYGLQASIVVPSSMRPERRAVLQALGARVVEQGDCQHDSDKEAPRIAAELRAYHVPTYHRDFVLGLGAGWMELLVAHPEIDYLFVPIGSGSSLCAAIAARDALGLHTRLVGVVVAPAYQPGREAGLEKEQSETAWSEDAAGHAAITLSPQVGGTLARHVSQIVVVSHDAAELAMRQYYLATHNVASSAAAGALAAVLKCRQAVQGKRVGLLLCGGNVAHDVFARILSADNVKTNWRYADEARNADRLREMAG